MTNMDPRAELKNPVKELSELQPGDSNLQALEAALPALSAEQAEKMLSVLSAQMKKTETDQATTAPSTAGVVSPTTQGLIDTVLDRGGDMDSRVSAIQKLIEGLKIEDSDVQRLAAEALKKLGGS
jgi:hypothetical protein